MAVVSGGSEWLFNEVRVGKVGQASGWVGVKKCRRVPYHSY